MRFLTEAAATVIFSIHSPLDFTKGGLGISQHHDSRFHPNRSRDFPISPTRKHGFAPGGETSHPMLVSTPPDKDIPTGFSISFIHIR
jgi:hypothetical protein